jgi:hypothetical protein
VIDEKMNSSSWAKLVRLGGLLPRKFLGLREPTQKKAGRAARRNFLRKSLRLTAATTTAAGAKTVPAAFRGTLLAFPATTAAVAAAAAAALMLPWTAPGWVARPTAAVTATALTAAPLAATLLGGLIWTSDDGGVVKAFEPEFGNLSPDKALDVADVGGVFGRDECDGVADGLGATRATDAVHVVFRFFRNVVVDDVGNASDVDAASGNVRSNHNFVFAGLKAFEGLDALVLGTVGVEDGDGVISGFEAAGDFISTMLGP